MIVYHYRKLIVTYSVVTHCM